MTFSESISAVLGKYATFEGRARRSEYWWFFLFSMLLGWGASVVGSVVIGPGGAFLSWLVSLAFLLPSLAVLVRRLHDTGRSGWNYCWVFTCIGAIPVIIWLATEGDRGDNRYGPPPA